MRILIETYGCTFNRADSSNLSKAITKAKHRLVAAEEDAELVVVNSCGVKDATEQRILNRLHLLAKSKVPTVVTGCLAQAEPSKILRANPKAAIVGTYAQDQIAAAIKAAQNGKQYAATNKSDFLEQSPAIDGVVARIQIARGCLGTCSFCQTKIARGGLESISAKLIVRLCEEAVSKGAKELQLTAQDTGCYGFDKPSGPKLPDLIEEICRINGDFRIRIGMMNPEHALKIMAGLLKAYANEKVYKFAHLPLQSGSNRVLKQMRRKHNRQGFEKAVAAIRKAFPSAMIETDVITGFPTETQKDFEQTLAALLLARPDLTNVSRYSARAKTSAAAMKQLPANEINERTGICWRLCRKIALEQLLARKADCTPRKVLVVEKQKNAWLARDNNYAPILLRRGSLGEFAYARIIDSTGSVLWGERCKK